MWESKGRGYLAEMSWNFLAVIKYNSLCPCPSQSVKNEIYGAAVAESQMMHAEPSCLRAEIPITNKISSDATTVPFRYNLYNCR